MAQTAKLKSVATFRDFIGELSGRRLLVDREGHYSVRGWGPLGDSYLRILSYSGSIIWDDYRLAEAS